MASDQATKTVSAALLERQKAFSRRLNQACDESSRVPPLGIGRQTTLAQMCGVSQQAAWKWCSGEAIPRGAKMTALADILEVDEGWLALGIESEVSVAEKKRNALTANAAVYMIAGMIMFEGGSAAFPSEKDPRSSYVDLSVIIRGQIASLHVSALREVDDNMFEATIPWEFEDVHCVGVLPAGFGKYVFFDFPSALIATHKVKRSHAYTLTVLLDGTKYHVNGEVVPRFKTIGEVL